MKGKRVASLLALLLFFSVLGNGAGPAFLAASDADAPEASVSQVSGDLTIIPPRSMDYTTQAAFRGDLFRTAYYEARIDELSFQNVYLPRTATLAAVYYVRGDYVKKGDVLADFTLEVDVLALEALEIDYASTLATYRQILLSAETDVAKERARLIELRTDPDASPDALLSQELRVTSAEETLHYQEYLYERTTEAQRAELTRLRADAEGFSLTAPVNGYLLTARSSLGETPEGTLIAQIFDPTADIFLRISASAQRSDLLETLKPGMEVEVKILAGTTGSINGEVSQNVTGSPTFAGSVVSNAALLSDSDLMGNSSVVVKLTDEAFAAYFDEALTQIRAHRFSVRVDFFGARDILQVPSTAVLKEGAREYTYVLEDDLLQKRYVQTGLTGSVQDADSRTYVQILEGIEEGDLVVVNFK